MSANGGAQQRDVAIAGGGLAGLACALSLGRAGFRVTLCERAARLGGKAGADPRCDGPGAFPAAVEHGPHFLAAWYRNLRLLMRHAGVAERLVAYDGFHYLLPSPDGAAAGRALPLVPRVGPLLRQLRETPRPRAGARRLGLEATAFALDLLARPDDERLDDLSVASLLHARGYADDALAALVHGQILRGSSIGAELASARTMRRLLRLWFEDPHPLLSVFADDIASALIDPLGDAVAGVAEIRRCTPVAGFCVERGQVAGLRLEDGERLHAAHVVATVPHGVLSGWVDDRVHAADRRLAGVHRLRSAPMAAMQLAFDRRLRGIPPGVLYLWGSHPPVNAIDLTRAWRSLRGESRTILGIVLSDFEELRGLSERRQVELVLEQLSRCVPDASAATLEAAAVNQNLDAPLFVNVVGSWRHRPDPAVAYGGPGASGRLHVAGDFTRTPIDVACMEGAVLSGLLAARAIAARAGVRAGIEPLEPSAGERVPPAAYRLARAGLAPALALGRAQLR